MITLEQRFQQIGQRHHVIAQETGFGDRRPRYRIDEHIAALAVLVHHPHLIKKAVLMMAQIHVDYPPRMVKQHLTQQHRH